MEDRERIYYESIIKTREELSEKLKIQKCKLYNAADKTSVPADIVSSFINRRNLKQETLKFEEIAEAHKVSEKVSPSNHPLVILRPNVVYELDNGTLLDFSFMSVAINNIDMPKSEARKIKKRYKVFRKIHKKQYKLLEKNASVKFIEKV